MENLSPSSYRIRVAGEVRAELARQKITATTLSERSGIPGATLSRRLNGLSPFDVDELAAIAAYLDVPIASFFPALAVASVPA